MKMFLYIRLLVLVIPLCMIHKVEASIITYDIVIKEILVNSLNIDLFEGDTIGIFSFQNSISNEDRNQGMDDSIVVDRVLVYDSSGESYSGQFDAWFDRDYYEFETTNTVLPFLFSLENLSPLGSGGGGIYFNESDGSASTNAFRISDYNLDSAWSESQINQNRILYNLGDEEAFMFYFGIRASDSTLITPEPETYVLMSLGILFFYWQRNNFLHKNIRISCISIV